MASRQSAVVREMYVRWARELTDPDLDPQQRAENGEHWADITREPGGVDYSETDEPGRPAMWITPKSAASDRVILGLHGGGFVGGSLYTHRKLFGHLAKAVGAKALLVHYRLNPEHHHPAPLHDAVNAYRWLLDQGHAAEHIALSGDSAGGGLCVTTVLRARELDLPLPAAFLLMSPWVDMELTSETLEANRDKDPFFRREFIQSLVDLHLSDGYSPKDPLVNPLYADLAGFPPMFVQAGADETGLGDAQRLAEHARTAGVDVRLDVFPEQQHTFQMAAGYAPEADDALARFASWVRPRLGL